MGKTLSWEQALQFFADATQSTVTNRTEIGADGGASWLTSHGVEVVNGSLANGGAGPYDLWYAFDFTVSVPQSGGAAPQHYAQSLVVGADYDWGTFGNDTGQPLGQFINQPAAILNPLLWGGNQQNSNVSIWSFDNAVETLNGLNDFLGSWMPQIQGWADSLNADGDWQGTAAGELKAVLQGYVGELAQVQHDLVGPNFTDGLAKARTQLGAAVVGMYNGYQAFMSDPLHLPINCLHQIFLVAIAGVKVNFTAALDGQGNPKISYTITPSPHYGDPTQQDFWDRVQSDAKKLWTSHVQSTLDPAAASAISGLDDVYGPLASSMSGAVIQPTLTPPPVSSSTTDGAGGDTSKGAGAGAGAAGAGAGAGGMPGGAGKPGAPTVTPGGGPGHQPGPPTVTPGGNGSPGSGQVELLDKNGKPVLGADGKPVMVPAGSTISPDGHVLDPYGNAVTGPGGKPIIAPKGATVQPGSPQGGYGPDGPGLKLPTGAKINPDGTVVDASGKPILDANGNPYALPKGATIGKDGSVLDASGKPIAESAQLLANEDAVLFNPNSGYRPGTSSAGFGDLGLGGGSLLSTVGGGGGGGFGPSAELTGTGGGLSARALTEGATPALNEAATQDAVAAEKAAVGEQEAASELQMMGRQVATSSDGMPMVPPMGGAGMGAGGAGGKERQRTTWLAEDEEVWGTDAGTVSGVIGR